MKVCILKNICGKDICCNLCKEENCFYRCTDKVKKCKWVKEEEIKIDVESN
jgi:hypothetical protein